MHRVFSILAGLALLICFALLALDFWRFFSSEGQLRGLTIDGLFGAGFEAQLAAWAALEESTWGNISRLLLRPVFHYTPLWVVFLLLALIFRIFGQKPR